MNTTTSFDFGSLENPLYCLEMANNHQGDVEHGKKIISEAAALAKSKGARVMIKLQFRNLDSFLHPADRSDGPLEAPLSGHTKRFKETELSDAQFAELVAHARHEGVPAYATPFDEDSVDKCVEMGFDVIKVGSPSAYDWPLLRKISSTGLPVIQSTGGMTLNEIDDVVDFFKASGNPLAIMHCVSIYPTANEDLQIDVVSQYRERYAGIPIGYSGHETPSESDVGGLALAKGAVLFERHFGLPTDKITLNAYSLSPEQAGEWVTAVQRASQICSNGQGRRPVDGEAAALLALKRGIYAKRSIPAGKVVTADDMFLALPCLEGQFHAGKYFEVVDSFAPMQQIDANMPIGLDLPAEMPRAITVSSIVARTLEVLDAAKVSLDAGTEIEISHQYGIERFFEYGAVIANIVNRDYCKKLIVQFPSQAHPAHKHIQKEETFQVLDGTVDLVLDGKSSRLEPGQKQVIEREHVHSFSTETGVIIEEISTTHISGDSVYDDPAIASDPAGRKTVLVLP
jgi:sialic acid synthase SpsE/mannose-6-phosphate isomerase-like protein (cupin superfamily)